MDSVKGGMSVGLYLLFCVFAADYKNLLKLLLAAVWLVLCAESNVFSRRQFLDRLVCAQGNGIFFDDLVGNTIK